jgi:hypothetical protein
MKHGEIRQKLSAYLDGAVTAEERMMIEDHLCSCRICSAALDELAKTVKHLKSLEELEPPAWMAEKIMVRVREEAGGKISIFRRLFFPLHIKLPIEAMALVFVTITGYLVFRTVQPEMRLAAPPTKEEYGGALPAASAPVPAPAAPAEPRKQPLRKGYSPGEAEKKMMPAKPPERKPLQEAKEAGAPTLAPELNSAARYGGRADRSAMQSLAATQKQEALPAAVPQADREIRFESQAAEGKSAPEEKSAKMKAKSARKMQEASFSITLSARESASAGREMENEVGRLGGRIIKTEASGNARVFLVLLEAQKIDVLLEKLRPLGEVRETGAVPGGEERDAEVTVLIKIIREQQE